MTDGASGVDAAVRPVRELRTEPTRVTVLVPVTGEVTFDRCYSGEAVLEGFELPWLRCWACGRSADWLLWARGAEAGATCRCGHRNRHDRLTQSAVERLATNMVATWPSLEAAEVGLGFDGSRLAS